MENKKIEMDLDLELENDFVFEEVEADDCIICADCGCIIDKEDAIEIDGEYYCGDCVIWCEHCERYHVASETEFFDVNTKYGEEMWCEHCVEDNAFKCDHCGCYHSYSSYDRFSVCTRYGWEDWCNDCMENDAVECACCGDLIDADIAYYNERRDEYYCDTCWEEDEDDSDIIWDYHDRPDLEFIGKEKPQWHDRQHYVGIELEVDNGNDRGDCAREIKEVYDNLYFNRDGSLNDGFEIITQPHTEEALYSIDWEKIFNICKYYNFESHDAGTCGLHIHISREFLGSTKEKQDLAIRKLIMFYNMFWNDILKISRRTEEQADNWAQKYCIDNRKEFIENIKHKHHGRYYAINNCNRNTVEFRLGRGTLNAKSFYAWIDFNLTLAKNSKNISFKNIYNVEMWLKGLKPTTIEYIKEKSAFGGAL